LPALSTTGGGGGGVESSPPQEVTVKDPAATKAIVAKDKNTFFHNRFILFYC